MRPHNVHSLERLNDDVLVRIYELLLPKQGLRSLSLSCKSIRESCMSVLFRASWCRAQFLTWDEFISSPLWPYVRCVNVLMVDPYHTYTDTVQSPICIWPMARHRSRLRPSGAHPHTLWGGIITTAQHFRSSLPIHNMLGSSSHRFILRTLLAGTSQPGC